MAVIHLYNTLTKKKEAFTPLHAPHVTMYNCGPTVYGYAHIGNYRSWIFAATLRRVLEYNGLEVRQVINITDVGHLVTDGDDGQDKMTKTAENEKKTAQEIAAFYTDAFLRDIRLVGIDTKQITFPRATEYIAEQIALVKTLEHKGFTYRTSDGVYFDTTKFRSYGKLGNINLTGLEEGKRVAVNEEKRNPTDFALWKFSDPAQGERQQEWESPWGKGYPGWHIECSAMAIKLLGETIDIHTGGIDHIPVHHNNEIAQSECATGKPFARVWMHNAFLNINNQKIAKSLGNTYTLSDLAAKGFDPLTYRYFLLGATYRTPMDFSFEALEAAASGYRRLQNSYQELLAQVAQLGKDSQQADDVRISKAYQERFLEAINDDLNTPRALALAFDLLKDESVTPAEKVATINAFNKVFGLDLMPKTEIAPDEVRNLARAREEARKKGDYKASDMLRDQIKALGYEVKDTPTGPVLRQVKGVLK